MSRPEWHASDGDGGGPNPGGADSTASGVSLMGNLMLEFLRSYLIKRKKN